MTIIFCIAAYLVIGAFIAGWSQVEDAPSAAFVIILYPLLPVMMLAAWLRELAHAIRDRREVPPAP